MRVKIQPEQQIQRINHLKNVLKEYASLSDELLIQRPNEKSWSVLEVIKHMSIGHLAYREKIKNALANTEDKVQKIDELSCTVIPNYLIKRFPPSEGKIRFKMKTTKKFQPMIMEEQVPSAMVISELEECLDELKGWVDYYRTEPISLRKFNSAVGAMVRFNIPEACEFILCHNERHFYQIEKILK